MKFTPTKNVFQCGFRVTTGGAVVEITHTRKGHDTKCGQGRVRRNIVDEKVRVWPTRIHLRASQHRALARVINGMIDARNAIRSPARPTPTNASHTSRCGFRRSLGRQVIIHPYLLVCVVLFGSPSGLALMYLSRDAQWSKEEVGRTVAEQSYIISSGSVGRERLRILARVMLAGGGHRFPRSFLLSEVPRLRPLCRTLHTSRQAARRRSGDRAEAAALAPCCRLRESRNEGRAARGLRRRSEAGQSNYAAEHLRRTDCLWAFDR